MFRLRVVAPLTAILALALTSVAFAASPTKITGGSTTLTLSPAAAQVLSNNHISASVTGVSSGYTDPMSTTLTFPISGGHVNTTTLVGVVRLKGALALSNGTKTDTLRKLTILSGRHAAALSAEVRVGSRTICRRITRRHRHARCVKVVLYRSERIATVTNVTITGGSATGTVKLTHASADVINDLAGKKVSAAGETIGTGVVTPTLK